MFMSWCVRTGSSGKFRGEGGKCCGKEGKGKRGYEGDSGGRDMGRARENKTEAGVVSLARQIHTACGMCRGDNGCGALSWKRESARLASF